MPTITKVWTFKSDSNPKKTYETLQHSDGSTSCNCMGWTRRVAADGSRTCKHTRLVDQDRADAECLAMKDYGEKASGVKPLKIKMVSISDVIGKMEKKASKATTKPAPPKADDSMDALDKAWEHKRKISWKE